MAIDGNALIARAKSQLGVQYSWGGGGASGTGYGIQQGASTKGFDCSSFMQYVFAGFGVSIPRVTYDQVKSGAQVAYKDLGVGDMVFFNQGSRGPEHVGLYIGNGQFIHAPKTGDVIKISNISDPYYRSIFTGGRRVAAVQGGGAYDPATNPAGPGAATQNVIPKTPEDMAAEYGWAYSFLQSNKELKGQFEEAVKNSWSAERFKAEVANTDWYKKNSETQRAVQVMEKTDPATFKANLTAARDHLQTKARELGAIMSNDQLSKMAGDVLRLGLTEEQVVQNIAGYIKFSDEKVLGGRAGQIEKYARETAYKNGMVLGDQTVKNYAVKMIKGQLSMEQLDSTIRTQAAGLFPAYEKQILAGEDAVDMAASYIDSMSNTLELSPDSVTLFDPMIKKAMNARDDKGQPIGMDITDFELLLKSDPRWKKTNNAREGIMTAGTQVLKDFGLMK